MSNSIFPENCVGFFGGGPGFIAKQLILTGVDTSHTTNMTRMFAGAYNLQNLDLSSFDTSNVTAMDGMFSSTAKLQSIIFGIKFIHKPEATTSGMFSGCTAPERPTGDTWNDVSFD